MTLNIGTSEEWASRAGVGEGAPPEHRGRGLSGEESNEPIKQPPHNLAAEQALLGAIFYDNAALERIPDGLKPEHFFEPFHQRLFAAILQKARSGQLAGPETLIDRFKADPAFDELGGIRYFADLIDRAPPISNAWDYAGIVLDLAQRRELIRFSGDVALAADVDHDRSAREQIEAAEADLYGIVERGQVARGPRAFVDVMADTMATISEAVERDGGLVGVSTGLVDLDRKLGGLFPSDLVILAGRPSMGKTALATNIAFHVARNYRWETLPDGERKTVSGGVVLFFSLEMSDEQLSLRILADASGVASDRLRRGQIDAADYARVRDAAIEIQESPLFIDDSGALPVSRMLTRARRQKRQTGLDLIVVDYLQLCTVASKSNANRTNEVTEITMGLKAMAKELNVPVIALSQLSREVEKRDDKRPQLADLRESGSIEQDADVVMFVFREEYYLSRAEPREGTPEHMIWQDEMSRVQGQAEVIIGKQRHGPIGTVRLSFEEETTRFGNLAREGRDFEGPGGRRPYADD